MKPFPIQVVSFGPGSQPEDDTLEYLTMPAGMNTYRPPVLPDTVDPVARAGAQSALAAVLAAIPAARADGRNRSVSLASLTPTERALVDQVLGEGEVAAQVLPAPDDDTHWWIQESVFAGVWRVTADRDGTRCADRIEIGAVPDVLREAAAADARDGLASVPGDPPPEVVNAPMLLTEVLDQSARRQPGQAAHVINLTLLPMSVADISWLDHRIGTGRVQVLSRGYGNCRITNARLAGVWRVVYYNSQDAVILNTVEVTDFPVAACAAAEDLDDSHERLSEVLQWVTGP